MQETNTTEETKHNRRNKTQQKKQNTTEETKHNRRNKTQ